MKKTHRKLALHCETLRTLTRRELLDANGGVPTNLTETCPKSGCLSCAEGTCTFG